MTDLDLPLPYGYTHGWQGSDAYAVRQTTDPNEAIVRLGLIGLGAIAQAKHIPALRRLQTIGEGVELVAGADIDQNLGQKSAKIHGFPWYSDYHEMLRGEALHDVLVLTRPTLARIEIISTCLKSGLSVFTEKPLVDDRVAGLPHVLAESQRLCELAEKSDLPLMVGFLKRFAPPYANAHHSA